MNFTTRRNFIKVSAASTLMFLSANGFSYNKKEQINSRVEAKKKKRRIIMNNDGNDVGYASEVLTTDPENLLKYRTLGLADSHVDSIFYCTGIFNFYYHRSNESELFPWSGKQNVAKYLDILAKAGTDPLKIHTDYCHKNNKEIFWSMRMNDTHDSNNADFLCKWKKDHPEYLVGKQGEKFPFGASAWSAANYEISEVRDKVFNILYDVCSRYDIDGIELDFFRHPVLFSPQMTGGPVTQNHCDLMTDLMGRIRKMTEKIALKRGRPLLIAIRIPDSVGYCKALGIDLVRWMEESLLDIVTGCGYFKLEPWETFANLCHHYDIPYYACLVKRRIQDAGEAEGETAIETWRGEALNAWKAGVDGIYTFNRFNPEDQIFRELGDPDLLASLRYVDQTVYINEDSWSKPEVWLKNGRSFLK